LKCEKSSHSVLEKKDLLFPMSFQIEGEGARKGNRNIDRRRETSRYAARDRRGKEADIFQDLKDVVPVVEESTVTHVDRIALLRVASTLCRMRKNAGPFLTNDLIVDDNPNVWNENTMSECLDGFVILADSDGTMLYITESVSIFLGLTQTDLIGRQIKDFIHHTDYDELMRISTEEAAASEEHRSTPDDAKIHKYGHRMVMRMKTVISPRGRNLNLKSALFKAIVCRCRSMQFETGKIMLIHASTTPAGQGNSICMSNSSTKGSETTSGSFMTRHTCDMRFSYVSENFNYLLRHESRSLMGSSFYDLVHPADLDLISDTMKELFRKGHCRSPYYRLIGANNSVAWVQTEATTVNHTTRGQRGQYILCVHSLVGMQSDLDSWTTAGTVCSDVLAAAQPACQFVKAEIDDVAEYLGRQPQFIDCYDFTPLIDSESGININEYRPMRDLTTTNQPQQSQQQQCSTINNPPRRKDSYNEVLEWLFRDQPGSPLPDTTTLCGTEKFVNGNIDERQCYNGFGNQPSQQQYKSNQQQPQQPARGQSIESRRSNGLVRMGGSNGTTTTEISTPKYNRFFPRGNSSSRSASIDACRPTPQPQQPRPRNYSITASAMDDANRFTNRAPMSTTITRNFNENNPSITLSNQRGSNGGRTTTTSQTPQRFLYSSNTEQCFNNGKSRTVSGSNAFGSLTAGFADFGVDSTSPEEIFSNGPSCGTTNGFNSTPPSFNKPQNTYSNPISTIPTNDFYTMSDARQCNSSESRCNENSTLQSSMLIAGSKRNAFGQSSFSSAAAVNVNQLPIVETPQQISREFFEEFRQQNPDLFPIEQDPLCDIDMCNPYQQCSSDSFEALAPFVPEEDVLQLNSEPFPLDINFPELDLSGYSFEPSFGKHIQPPNPFVSKMQSCNKNNSYMLDSQDSYIPAKRARIDEAFPLSY
jgi:PAS domain S-box-containing protein